MSRIMWSVKLGVTVTRWWQHMFLLLNNHQNIQQISAFRMWEDCHPLHSSIIHFHFIPLTKYWRTARSHWGWGLRFIAAKDCWRPASAHIPLHKSKCGQTNRLKRKGMRATRPPHAHSSLTLILGTNGPLSFSLLYTLSPFVALPIHSPPLSCFPCLLSSSVLCLLSATPQKLVA